MSDKIKDCPFCGSKAELGETEGCDFLICCTGCHLTMFDRMEWGEEGYDGEKDVIDSWNRRVEG